MTSTASADLKVTVESSPGVPVSYAELVLIPFDDPALTGAPAPSLYSLFRGCAPMLGPPDGGSPACNRVLVIDGQRRAGRPAGTLLRLRDPRTVRQHRSRRCAARPGDVLAGHVAGPVAPAAPAERRRLGRLPRPRRRQLRLVDPRRGSGGELPRHRRRRDHRDRPQRGQQLREHAGDAGRHELHRRHPRRGADAQHPLVLRPRRQVPEDARAFQFLAAGPRFSADPQRRALVGAARARPVDGRHGRGVPQARDRRASAQSPLPAGQAGARSGLPASDRLRPDHAHPGHADRRLHLRRQRAGAGARAATTATSTGTSRR